MGTLHPAAMKEAVYMISIKSLKLQKVIFEFSFDKTPRNTDIFLWSEPPVDNFNNISIILALYLSVFQDEKNQMMTTNVWLKQVRKSSVSVDLLLRFYFIFFYIQEGIC